MIFTSLQNREILPLGKKEIFLPVTPELHGFVTFLLYCKYVLSSQLLTPLEGRCLRVPEGTGYSPNIVLRVGVQEIDHVHVHCEAKELKNLL